MSSGAAVRATPQDFVWVFHCPPLRLISTIVAQMYSVGHYLICVNVAEQFASLQDAHSGN